MCVVISSLTSLLSSQPVKSNMCTLRVDKPILIFYFLRTMALSIYRRSNEYNLPRHHDAITLHEVVVKNVKY